MREWQAYEELLRRIYTRLGEERGATVVCSGPACKVTGQSGVKHQVDVLSSFTDGLHEYFTAIECKSWKSKVNKDAVIKAAHIRKDAGLAKVVIVTTKGFTPDAVKLARSEHVELVTLRKPTEADWAGRIRNFEIDISITLPELSKREFSTVDPATEKDWLYGRWNSLKYADGTVVPVRLLEEDFLEGMNTKELDKNHCETIVFDPPALLMSSEGSAEVTSLYLEGGFRTTAPKKIRIRGEDRVAYIMRTDFGRRRHVVDNNDLIHDEP